MQSELPLVTEMRNISSLASNDSYPLNGESAAFGIILLSVNDRQASSPNQASSPEHYAIGTK